MLVPKSGASDVCSSMRLASSWLQIGVEWLHEARGGEFSVKLMNFGAGDFPIQRNIFPNNFQSYCVSIAL